MSVKVFQTNKVGKIEFTRCELEKLLNETYNEGYRDGENHVKNSYWTWTSPYINTLHYRADEPNAKTSTSAVGHMNEGNESNEIPIKTFVNNTSSNSNAVTESTNRSKDIEINFDELAKTVDAILATNFKNPLSQSYIPNEPFSSLEKELRGL